MPALRLGLKKLNVLFVNKQANFPVLLKGWPRWQAALFPLLARVPRRKQERSPAQNECFEYVVNMAGMVHHHAFGEPGDADVGALLREEAGV